jgi:hypothetical protein
MDASPAVRRVAFVAIVCAFAALGAYLLGPLAHRGGAASAKPPAASSPRRSAATRSEAPASGAAAIYQWLPFTRAGLAAAAAIVVRFGDAYGTYSYTEDGSAYVAPLQPITSAQLVGQIEAAYEAPGVAATRQSQQQVAAGTTTIGSIRAFGPGSLTFVVEVDQRLTDATGHNQQSTDYAVTVSGAGSIWQVTDVELAAAGNS